MSDRYSALAAVDMRSITASQATSRSASIFDSVWNKVAAITAPIVDRRLRDASAGVPYLSEMTSPCSVILMAPCTAPYGSARIASAVGPPPRPTVPPRPWKKRRPTP